MFPVESREEGAEIESWRGDVERYVVEGRRKRMYRVGQPAVTNHS